MGPGSWACKFHIPHVQQNLNATLVAASKFGEEELEKIKKHFLIQNGFENHYDIYHNNLDGVIVASTQILHD